MSYVAFVPARSGSKRLPNKNIKLLGGKPLVVWTLEACINCSEIDKVIFSTDSDEYWDLVRRCLPSDKLCLHKRSAEEAGDKVKIFDYLKNNANEIFPEAAENFLLALPTMPFRSSKHISEAVRQYKTLNKPVFSAVEYDFSIAFAFSCEDNGSWTPLFDESPMVNGNTRSQDQIKAYHPNGALYIRPIRDLKNDSLKTLYAEAIPYLMDKVGSVDIDTEEDFIFAEAIVNSSCI
jgi:N-acylneuraminate cytidylyltransferase/CMP-N,N'-diacetyllegionaminic acid synthase